MSKETSVNAKAIEEELLAMMKEIFIGKVEKGEGILLTLFNGQKFRICVCEEKE